MNREQFLRGRTAKVVEVDVPDFGVVKMRELPESIRVREFDTWLRPGEKVNRQRQLDARLKIISLCVVGDDGQPYLSDADFPEMRQMPSAVISRMAARDGGFDAGCVPVRRLRAVSACRPRWASSTMPSVGG